MGNKNITQIKDVVESLLQRSDACKNDDRILILRTWQIYEPNLEKSTYQYFVLKFVEGTLPSPESIRRIRQKLQEQQPELRGESYRKRKNKAKTIKNKIIKNERFENKI
jgi:hypothetical protein